VQPIETTNLKKPIPSLTIAFVLILTLFTSPIQAESLEDLRASGAIGEGYNGYVIARHPRLKRKRMRSM